MGFGRPWLLWVQFQLTNLGNEGHPKPINTPQFITILWILETIPPKCKESQSQAESEVNGINGVNGVNGYQAS